MKVGGEGLRAADMAPRVATAIAGYALGGSLLAFFTREGRFKGEETDPEEHAAAAAALFESTALACVGGLLVGAMVCFANPARFASTRTTLGLLAFPLVVQGLGVVASAGGAFSVRVERRGDPVAAMHLGLYVTALLTLFGLAGAAYWFLGTIWLPFFLCGAIGVGASLAFARRPTGRPAKGELALASWLEALFTPVSVIAGALFLGYEIGDHCGLAFGGAFGAATTAGGAAACSSYMLTMRGYGPIADAAVHVFLHSGAKDDARVDALRAAGERARSLSRGHGSAVTAFVTFAAFAAYVGVVSSYKCSAWGERSGVPVRAFGALLAECSAAGNAFDGGPLSVPAVLVGGAAGVLLVAGALALGIREAVDRERFTRAEQQPRSALFAVLVSAMPVGVGVLFKYGLGVGGEAVGTLLLTAALTGGIAGLFLENARRGGLAHTPTYLPITGAIALSLVAAPLFV